MLRPGKSNSLPSYGGGGHVGGGGYNGGGYSQGGGGQSYGGYSGGQGGGYDNYGSASLHHSSSSMSSSSRSRRNSESPILKILKTPLFYVAAGCFVLFCSSLHYRGKHNKILTTIGERNAADAINRIKKIERERDRFRDEARENSRTSDNLQRSIRDLKEKNNDLRKQNDGLRDPAELLAEQKKAAARDEAWKKQVYLLQNATARESKRNALSRFGAGPHHVIFKVQFPETDHQDEFMVEMAPLDLMPHAVHFFLEQVFHELWDGTYIYLNGPHILQAGPQEWYDEEDGESLKPFKDTQLENLVFPEYHAKYPHKPMTLGYSGRPGGPDWYINKQDNSVAHGPGGQQQHDLQEQADSCFAKVVSGHDVIDRMIKLPTEPHDSRDWAYYFEEPVQIISARIKEPLPPPEKVEDQHHKTPEELAKAREAHHNKRQRKTHHEGQAAP